MTIQLPVLVGKALFDTGFDVCFPGVEGWTIASISGSDARIMVRAASVGVLLAVPEPTMAHRIGLVPTEVEPPSGMADIGMARDASHLYESLQLLHALQTRSPALPLTATPACAR